MATKRKTMWLGIGVCLAAALGLLLAFYHSVPAAAQNSTNPNGNVAPFDFSDNFYTANGIVVTDLDGPGGRVGIPGNVGGFGFPTKQIPANANGVNWVTDNTNTDPTRTTTRVTQTTGGFDMNANIIYYSIMGTLNDDTFFTTDPSTGQLDAAGQRAFNLGNQFRAFISPQQFINSQALGQFATASCGVTNGPAPQAPANTSCWVASPAPPNRRQDNVFDTQNTYFCQNLLGLWTLVFVTYTPQAYTSSGAYASSAAQAVLAPLMNLNGATLDGTPVIDTTAEEDGLTALGYVYETTMPHTSHTGAPRYVV